MEFKKKAYLHPIPIVAMERPSPLCRYTLEDGDDFTLKDHMLDHMVRHCLETGLNPCSYWCFQDEDAMRLQMGIANHSKQGTVDKFSLNRWCLQFFAKKSIDAGDRVNQEEVGRGWKRPHENVDQRGCKMPRGGA